MVAQQVKLLAIVGPTASGKTNLAIDIAKNFNGEIISADSRTIYKDLDIGTAKPSLKERLGMPHFGFDLVGPGETFTVADFKNYANKKIEEIRARYRLPIVVGGSGLYVDTLLYDFNLIPPDKALREKLQKLSINELQNKILKSGLIMPENVKNKRYLVRALERGRSVVSKKPLQPGYVIIGVNPPKNLLKKHIKNRIQLMIKQGVAQEAKHQSIIYGWNSTAMTADIYRVFKDVLAGDKTVAQGVEEAIKSDLRLAKKQTTWLKRNKDINWFENSRLAYDWFKKELDVN